MRSLATLRSEKGPTETIELQLERLVPGGEALGHLQGKAVFVAKALPGERVRARLIEEHSSYSRAELVDVLEPSPLRRSAPCPYFARCGGCDWQMLPYAEQLEAKRKLLLEVLRRVGQLEYSGPLRVEAAGPEWAYRDRVQLHRDRAGRIGFYGFRSHAIVEVETCPIAGPAVEQALRAVRQVLRPTGLTAGAIERIEIEAGDRGPACLTVRLRRGARLRRGQVEGLLKRLAARPEVGGVALVGGPKLGQFSLQREIDGNVLQWSPGSFAQASGAGNRQLAARAVELMAPLEGQEVLELHAGHGNFTLGIARRAARVVAVESGRAAEDARRNVEAARLANVDVLREDAGTALSRLLASNQHFDCVLLDPPREGARTLIDPLCRLGAAKILYVACEASALARDLRGLIDRGYRLIGLDLLDLFPQTAHFETLAVLERTR